MITGQLDKEGSHGNTALTFVTSASGCLGSSLGLVRELCQRDLWFHKPD